MSKSSRRARAQIEQVVEAPVEGTPVPAVEVQVEAAPAVEAPAKAKPKRYASIAVLANPSAVIARLTPIEATGKKSGTLTHAKYSLFEVGLTVAQIEAKFVEHNWPRMKARNQLRWDIEHGFVELEVPQAVEAAQ